jgi:negative regulator of sigma E activity
MPPDESPKAKYERLQRRFQEEILTKYPNPERKGCPGESALRSLAAKPLTQRIENDPDWEHVTHCSECYREFLAFQSATKQQRQTWREAIRWGIALVALATVSIVLYFSRGFVFESKRPQNAELAYLPRRINIESMTRSATRGGEKQPIYLDRDREALTIQLPIGSMSGEYEFQLRTPADQVILTQSASASIEHGVTSFLVKLDLNSLRPGEYKMEVRRVPFDWQYYPVVLR